MSLVTLFKGKSGPSGFGYGSTAEEVTEGLNLGGKTILVTGVGSGLGVETARVLAKRGARVLGTARTKDKAAEAVAPLGSSGIGFACDLAEPATVTACVAEVKKRGFQLDAIICNAGVMAVAQRTIQHGQELQFLTNHIGHFMLVTGLLDSLAPGGRVAVVASAAHSWAPPEGICFDDLTLEKSYSPNSAYGQSKLANILFARALARRFAGTGKTANALHPGVIATNLTRHMNPAVRLVMPIASALAMKSIPQGAATQTYVAVHPGAAKVNGEYFADCNPAKSSRHARNDEMAERLWDVTEKIVGPFVR